MKMILGEYVEKGMNHGKKFFQKVSSPTDSTTCFVYYWDNRDGPSFEGWWFGREVGGNEVWSHNGQIASPLPPSQGWKIPFAGPIRTTLSVNNKAEYDKMQAAAAKANADKEKVKAALEQLKPVVDKAQAILQEAKKTAGDYTNVDSLKAADDMLSEQGTLLATMRPRIEGAQLTEVQPLVQQLRSVMSAVNAERGKITMSKPKALKVKRDQDMAQFDSKVLAGMIQSVVDAANKADDMVEKALIASEMIDACGDDVEEAKKAVTQTEAAVKTASVAVNQARTLVNQKAIEKTKIKSPMVLAEADAELKKFQKQLAENQAKLGKLNNVRQDWAARSHAKTMVKELIEKLSPVEVEVDSVEEKVAEALAGPLSGSSPDKTVQEAVGKDLSTVILKLGKVQMMFEGKRAMTKMPFAVAEVDKVEERLRRSTSRLNKLKSDLQQVKERENHRYPGKGCGREDEGCRRVTEQPTDTPRSLHGRRGERAIRTGNGQCGIFRGRSACHNKATDCRTGKHPGERCGGEAVLGSISQGGKTTSRGLQRKT